MIRHWLTIGLAGIWLSLPAAATADLETLLQTGHERPDQALDELDRSSPAESSKRHEMALVRALILADNGREVEAMRAARELRAPLDVRSQAGADLVLAKLYYTQGRIAEAAAAAKAATEAFTAACVTGCNVLRHWGAERVAASIAEAGGQIELARQSAQRARDIADSAGSPSHLALSEAQLAVLTARNGDGLAARAHMGLARRAAGAEPAPALVVRLANADGMMNLALGDQAAAQQAFALGLTTADRSELHRQAAILRINLADVALRQRRPADALALADRAAPVLRRHGDQRRERVLTHNTGLARLALGQLDRGRTDLDHSLELWQRAGARGELLPALREYGDALAAAGDLVGALTMHHRERDLEQELLSVNREVAMAELRVRFQRDEQQREIELGRSEGELRQLRLANQDLHQRIWALVAVVAVLGAVLVTVLLRRLWLARHRLHARQATLRDLSERDPLTGLANRRHIQAMLGARQPQLQGFRGALMVVDIDHFKRVNDRCGHAGGDEVLKAVAGRLFDALADQGLVARWGGEEFLVWLPSADAESTRLAATTLLESVAATPIAIESGTSLQVTVSIGFAAFPLPNHGSDLTWEQAVNLVDMALYQAKSQGRNRAVGVDSAEARDPEALSDIARDFELSERLGRVRLTRIPGPDVELAQPVPA